VQQDRYDNLQLKKNHMP